MVREAKREDDIVLFNAESGAAFDPFYYEFNRPGRGQHDAESVIDFMNAIISGIFPVMAARSGAIPFAVFALMMVVQFIVVLSIYPETKGVSLEEMEHRI